MKLRALLIVFLFIASSAFAQTYTETFYLCATGDGSAPEAGACATAFDAADFNNAANWDTDDSDDGKIGPNDRVIVLDDAVMRSTLTMQQSGLSGKPITLQGESGGSARITGGELVTTWTTPTDPAWDLQDALDDNVNTGWTVVGSAVEQNGRLEVTTANGTQNSYRKAAGGAHTEAWVFYKVRANSLTLPNNDDRMLGAALNSGASQIVMPGVWNVSGVLNWKVTYNNDAGQQFDTATLPFSVGTTYSVSVHWKKATGVGANNGIIQVWIDGEPLTSLTNIDNDLQTIDSVLLGDRFGTNDTGVWYFNDVRFGSSSATVFPNVWVAALDGATTSTIAVVDDVLGENKPLVAGCVSPNDFYHDATNDLIYLYSTTDPDTKTVQVARRVLGVDLNGKNYITVDGLTIDLSGNAFPGAAVSVASANATGVAIQNNTLRWSWNGVYFYNGTCNASLIANNSAYGNHEFGINIDQYNAGAGTECVIRANEVYDGLAGGIEVRANYYIVERNVAHDNGTSTLAYQGIHVYSGGVGEGTGDNNIIRYNTVYGQLGLANDGAGVMLDQWCDNNQVYYNIAYGNQGYGYAAFDAAGSVFYNNTAYGNALNPALELDAEFAFISSASDLTTVTAKNNIARATGAATIAIAIDPETSNNTLDITNNDWTAAGTNWYLFNVTSGNVLATWNALAGIGTDLNSDPLFMSTSDFHLRAASPAINAGIDVGLTGGDFERNPIIGPPDIGAYEDQTFQGSFRIVQAIDSARSLSFPKFTKTVRIVSDGSATCYFRLFTDADTPAPATVASLPLFPGESLGFTLKDCTSSTDLAECKDSESANRPAKQYSQFSYVCDAGDTSAWRVYYK